VKLVEDFDGLWAAFSLDTTWSFRCEDLTAPRVVGAQARA
jgi:hypothetical protein